MKILAVDTSTKSCSVAIVDNENLLAELTLVIEDTNNRHLMDMVDKAVKLSGITCSMLDGFAVIKGPGTFTGLRIGISTVKGLAFALNKPVAGISSLEALAMQVYPFPDFICSLLDARRNEVYYAGYQFQNGRLIKIMKEQVARPERLSDSLKKVSLFVGNGGVVYKKTIQDKMGDQACFATPGQNVIKASTVAFLGLTRFIKQDEDNVHALVPDYIRQSDAELNFKRKKG